MPQIHSLLALHAYKTHSILESILGIKSFVLSPLLFAVVLDVVFSEAKVVYLPSCCMLMN